MNFIYRDFRACGDSSGDAAMARLRTIQMQRAVCVAAGFAAPGPVAAPRTAPLSGDLVADDDPGGDGARVIDEEALRRPDSTAASRQSWRSGQ
ncbi:hypothetical protein [Roseovarius arcticus]|uniref:hypothetical protein n=1 Tax=Roseovarius arcticus TaxID=2547404 RepID=UPI0011106C30|nr:hypothetical protein [Roseovarius arcticus]